MKTLKKENTKENTKIKKKPAIRSLIKKLDKVFSIYVRKGYADHAGNVDCYTCGKVYPWKVIQNGHYISRAHHSLRFSLKNCRPQCVGCNVFKHGAMDEFALALERERGNGILKELNSQKHRIKRFTVTELEDLIAFYSKEPSRSVISNALEAKFGT